MTMKSGYESLVLCIPEECSLQNERLEVVASAVKQAAKELGLRIESIYKRNLLSVSVMVKVQDEENWVYSDWKKDWDQDLIYRTICNYTWALNFEKVILSSAGT
ncbi:MAG: hypothetical protein JSW01_06070 [Candidatus Bathyarchaeota archaeon]|nr:MAG: hypothetical protein JSW01_06070 [Candidatus Bathyarchaeota archaeon]